jgi:8-oxo-dGTP pyrophosphatase MutT (NUDIX family)
MSYWHFQSLWAQKSTVSMLQAILKCYLKRFPDEAADFEILQKQLATGEKLNDRKNFNGHACGSGIVLSADRSKILLIHHKVHDAWLQPGGHWEDDEETDPLAAARREVQEETGVTDLTYLPIDPKLPLVPLDLSTHPIPARPLKAEPAHWHHDFRYVFVTDTEVLTHQVDEVNAAAWFVLDAPETKAVSGIVAKLRQFGFAE